MKVKAAVSFAGTISMGENEVMECAECDALSNLLKIGYVVPVETKKAVKSVENKRNNRQSD